MGCLQFAVFSCSVRGSYARYLQDIDDLNTCMKWDGGMVE